MNHITLYNHKGKRVFLFTATLKVIGIIEEVDGEPAVVKLKEASVTSLIDVQMSISRGLEGVIETFPSFTISVDAIRALGFVG